MTRRSAKPGVLVPLVCTAALLVPVVVILVAPSMYSPVWHLVAGKVPLTGAVLNGINYAAVSSIIQVALGLSVFVALARVRRSNRRAIRCLGYAAELIYVLPYLMPSTGVYSALDWYLDPSGPLSTWGIRGPTASGLLELHLLSAVALSPFSYLAFRLYEAVGRKHLFEIAIRPGHLQPLALGASFGSLASLVGGVVLFRFLVMMGKFDIPFLVGAHKHTLPALVNVPVYLDDILTSSGGIPDRGLSTAGILLLSVLVLLVVIGVIRWAIHRGTSWRRRSAAAVGGMLVGVCRRRESILARGTHAVVTTLLLSCLQVVGVVAVVVAGLLVGVPLWRAVVGSQVDWGTVLDLRGPAVCTWAFVAAPAIVGLFAAAGLVRFIREYRGWLVSMVRHMHTGFYALPTAIFFLAYWWLVLHLPTIHNRVLSSVVWYGGYLVLLGIPIAFVLAQLSFPADSVSERIFRRTLAQSELWSVLKLPMARRAVAFSAFLVVMTALVSSDLFAATRALEGVSTANMAYRDLIESGEQPLAIIGGTVVGFGNAVLVFAPLVFYRLSATIRHRGGVRA